MEKTQLRGERVVYLDCLRILAALAVIFIHSAAQNWDAVRVTSFEWQVFNAVSSAVRWAVPVFCMISGALLLDNDRPLDLKKLWGTKLLRIVTAFVFWSALYALMVYRRGAPAIDAAVAFVKGNYHMWYLYVIAGLYLAAPFLRKITESRKLTELYLALAFLFTVLLPRAVHFLSCLELPYAAQVLKDAGAYGLGLVNFLFAHICAFYFVLGHYLHKYEIGPVLRRGGYVLGIAGYVLTVWLTNWHSVGTGAGSTAFYAEASLNVFLTAAAVFLFGKYVLAKLEPKGTGLKVLKHLSGCTFGIYLIHPLVLDILRDALGFSTLAFHPAAGVVLVAVTAAAVSYLLAAVLNRLPVIGKYIT